MPFRDARLKALDTVRRQYPVRRVRRYRPADFEFAETWAVDVETDGPGGVEVLTLTLQFPYDFPLVLPRVYLNQDDLRILRYPPSVGTDGFVCTFDPNTTHPNPDAPGQVVLAAIHQAINIIERARTGIPAGTYDDEFIAYWENRYPGEPQVEMSVLSLVDEHLGAPDQITYAWLRRSVGPFQAVLYSRQEEFDAFAPYLEGRGIKFDTFPTFHLGEVGDLNPPFSWRTADVLRLIEARGRLEDFQQYLRRLPGDFTTPVVTFTRILNGRHLVFGWRHASLLPERSSKYQGRRRGGPQPTLLTTRDRFTRVTRLSPQVLTRERLRRRTAGETPSALPTSPVLGVAGLGSVGSHLTSMLATLDVGEFRLVDPDVLNLENLKRHLLGVDDVGRAKVDGLRRWLYGKDPLRGVHVRKTRVVELMLVEPSFLNGCDFAFFCLGDPNAETWLSNALARGTLLTPSFFLWIEPYSAGAHCVFLNGQDGVQLTDAFDGNLFKYNVIAAAEHGRRTFARREAGCQTTHFPFDGASVTLFLGALLPELLRVMTTPGHPSACFSWVGNKKALATLGLEVSAFGQATSSFTLVRHAAC